MITKMGSEQPDGVWPTHSYDVWHQPDTVGGCLIVSERGPKGELCWRKQEDAVDLVKKLKRQYPRMNWLVREETLTKYGSVVSRKIVYMTKDDNTLKHDYD